MPLTTLEEYENKRVRNWIIDNRGVLSRVAVTMECTPQFVQQVAYGKSRAAANHPVEQALKRLGWPGIRRSKRHHA